MKKYIIFIIGIVMFGSFLSAQTMGVDEADIIPGPMQSVAEDGMAFFSFDVAEMSSVAVPVGDSPAMISLTLSNVEVISSTLKGHDKYFDVVINPYDKIAHQQFISFRQKADFPADGYSKISMDVIARGDSDETAANNGGKVLLDFAGSDSESGSDSTSIYTYTCNQNSEGLENDNPCVAHLFVKYSFFKVENEGSKSKLIWEVISEINSAFFVIEKSRSGVNFYPIGRVDGKGTTMKRQAYEFYDDNPSVGLNYYRIMQVDLDGSVHYTKTEAVQFAERDNNVLEVYPNPAPNSQQLIVTGNNLQEISIFDIVGNRVLYRETSGDSRHYSLNISDFTPGIYVLVNAAGERVKITIIE